MKSFKQIIQEGEQEGGQEVEQFKKQKRRETVKNAIRQYRLKSSISDSRILNRLANIASRIDNRTITPEEGYDLYHKEATKIKDIKEKIK